MCSGTSLACPQARSGQRRSLHRAARRRRPSAALQLRARGCHLGGRRQAGEPAQPRLTRCRARGQLMAAARSGRGVREGQPPLPGRTDGAAGGRHPSGRPGGGAAAGTARRECGAGPTRRPAARGVTRGSGMPWMRRCEGGAAPESRDTPSLTPGTGHAADLKFCARLLSVELHEQRMRSVAWSRHVPYAVRCAGRALCGGGAVPPFRVSRGQRRSAGAQPGARRRAGLPAL